MYNCSGVGLGPPLKLGLPIRFLLCHSILRALLQMMKELTEARTKSFKWFLNGIFC